MSPSVAFSYCPFSPSLFIIPFYYSFVICSLMVFLSLMLCASPLLPPFVLLFTSASAVSLKLSHCIISLIPFSPSFSLISSVPLILFSCTSDLCPLNPLPLSLLSPSVPPSILCSFSVFSLPFLKYFLSTSYLT